MNLKIRGPQTTVEFLAQKLLQRWIPKWYEAFYDTETGGFHERLGEAFQPVPTGYRRLLTQCRQIATYSHAASEDKNFKPGARLDHAFKTMVKTYHRPGTGGWIFSVDEKGNPLDESYDLYALAFVIFACAHYYRLRGDAQAKDLARTTLSFIDRNFRYEDRPGLAEALDKDLMPVDRPRRHESHMHFLEACLFAARIWEEKAYMDMADELTALFFSHFYKADRRLLSEYYDLDLVPAPDKDCIITEPGHYCEWIWLLKKYARMTGVPEKFDAPCRAMLDWANRYGWDTECGGIYDELDEKGAVVTDTKRIWPFTEALKANALMLDSGVDKDAIKIMIAGMVEVFSQRYMQERGFWTEWLTRDLKPAVDYMPGTTPYHVYFGIMETRGALQARGTTRSLRAGPALFFYSLRRRLSGLIRRLRKSLRMAQGME